MELFINNESVDFKLEGENNVFEIVKELESWLSSQNLVLEELTLNEDNRFFPGDPALRDFVSGDISKLDITANSVFSNAYTMLQSIYRYTKNMLAVSEEKKFDDFQNITDGISWILEGVSRVSIVLNLSADTEKVAETLQSLEIKKEKLGALAKEDVKKANKYFETDVRKTLLEIVGSLEKLLAESEIKMLKMLATEINEENVLERLDSLKELINPVTALLDKIVLNLQTGKDFEAMFALDKFSEGVQSIFNVLGLVSNALDIDYSKIEIDGVSFESILKEVQENLKEVLDAFKNEDYVSISDLLEYEIKDRLLLLLDYISLLEREVENGK